MTIKLICSFILSFLFATGFGKYYIPWLHRQKANQEIKSEVTWHKSKSGTPTMGGVMFILGVLLSILTIGFPSMMQGKFVHLFVFLFALVFGAIGFLDDWEKIKNAQNLGLTAGMKFLLQLSAALVFIFLMRRIGFVRPNLYIPFVGTTVPIPEWLYFVFAAFVIVGTVNAVNLTDGVDGLATGERSTRSISPTAWTGLPPAHRCRYACFSWRSPLPGGRIFLNSAFSPRRCWAD